jgi:hypothetical protein
MKALFIGLLFIAQNLFCQENDKHWVTGSGPYYLLPFCDYCGALDFTFNRGGNYRIDTINAPNLGFGSAEASVSNSRGELMLSSSNYILYNRFGEIIENGAFLGGKNSIGPNYFNSTMLVPALSITSSIYHNFYLVDTITSNSSNAQKLEYAQIDVDANNGRGKVIKRDEILIDSKNVESPAACRHANGRDWWIIVPESAQNIKFYFKT